MASRTFSMTSWFSSRGHSARTPITVDGYKAVLTGMPAEYTDAGLSALAATQSGDVRFRTPSVITDSGVKATSSKLFPPKDVSDMLAQHGGIQEKAKGKTNRLDNVPALPEPSSNGAH